MKILLVILFVLASVLPVYAGRADKVMSNVSSNQTKTIPFFGIGKMSFAGTFGNRTTGRVDISESINDGASYAVVGSYSTTPWQHHLDTTKGVRTNVKLTYTNKSKKAVKAKGNVWTNVE